MSSSSFNLGMKVTLKLMRLSLDCTPTSSQRVLGRDNTTSGQASAQATFESGQASTQATCDAKVLEALAKVPVVSEKPLIWERIM